MNLAINLKTLIVLLAFNDKIYLLLSLRIIVRAKHYQKKAGVQKCMQTHTS